jgi:hypothetical protein
MKNKRNVLYSLNLILTGVINFPVQAQQKNVAQDAVETKDVSASHGPNGIVRTIKQDRKANIWITLCEGFLNMIANLLSISPVKRVRHASFLF